MDYVFEMTSPNRMRESIEMLPRGLAAYREIYLKTTQRIDNQPEEYCSLAKATLIWLVCAMRPITVPELREALAIKINTSSLDSGDFSTTKSIVGACKGLVTIGNDEVIQLLHHTAREYLDSNFGWLEEPSIRVLAAVEAAERAKATAQRDITLKLLTYISFHTFEAGPCNDHNQYLERGESNRLYSYGSRHWGDHLKSSGPYVSDIVDLGTNSLLTRLLGSEKKWRSSIQAFSYGGLPHGNPISWDRSFPEGFTSLHLAAKCGVEPLVTALLGSHQVNAKDCQGRAPLSYAAEKGHVDVAMCLLKAGAHVDTGDLFDQTPLVYAAEEGHKEVVRCLLDNKADTERRDAYGRTPLALAVLGGDHAISEILLEGGADIEEKDTDDMTPLSLVAENGQATTVEYLLQKNAKAETRDDLGRTPLLQAVGKGHIEVVRVLLDWGVDIEAKDFKQRTALTEAVRNDHISLVKSLLQKGCDTEARGLNGKTALLFAVKSDHEKTRSLRNRNNDSIPRFNSNIDQPGESAAEENFEMCQILLDNKANPNGTGVTGWSPLLEAERLGRADITRFFLRAGADPSLDSLSGITPLEFIRQGRRIRVDFMIEELLGDDISYCYLMPSAINDWVC